YTADSVGESAVLSASLAIRPFPMTIIERALEGAVVLAVLATVPLFIIQELEPENPLIPVLDWGTWAIFCVAYAVGLAASAHPRQYVRSNWLSLGVVVLSFPLLPAPFLAIRLARLVRIIRVALVVRRGLDALHQIVGRHAVLEAAA